MVNNTILGTGFNKIHYTVKFAIYGSANKKRERLLPFFLLQLKFLQALPRELALFTLRNRWAVYLPGPCGGAG